MSQETRRDIDILLRSVMTELPTSEALARVIDDVIKFELTDTNAKIAAIILVLQKHGHGHRDLSVIAERIRDRAFQVTAERIGQAMHTVRVEDGCVSTRDCQNKTCAVDGVTQLSTHDCLCFLGDCVAVTSFLKYISHVLQQVPYTSDANKLLNNEPLILRDWKRREVVVLKSPYTRFELHGGASEEVQDRERILSALNTDANVLHILRRYVWYNRVLQKLKSKSYFADVSEHSRTQDHNVDPIHVQLVQHNSTSSKVLIVPDSFTEQYDIVHGFGAHDVLFLMRKTERLRPSKFTAAIREDVSSSVEKCVSRSGESVAVGKRGEYVIVYGVTLDSAPFGTSFQTIIKYLEYDVTVHLIEVKHPG